MESTVVVFEPHILDLLGAVIPLLVALVTKARASSAVKGITNLALSAMAGGVAAAVSAATEGVVLEEWLVHMLTVFVLSTTTYVTVHKPTGLAARVAAVAPSAGIGTAGR